MSPAPDHGEATYRGSGRLAGRKAIVTGGDSGIGRAVALAFAREGADVAIAYLDEHDDAAAATEAVRAAGREAIPIAGDLGSEAHCEEVVRRAVEAWGQIDVLVNNAGRQTFWPSLADLPADELERTFRSNIIAQFLLCKAALPHLPRGAAIINTTSIQAFEPTPEILAYAATKGAIVTFTKGLARALAGRGIRVNAVAPGPVWTPLIPTGFPADGVPEFGVNTAAGRPAQPAELAPVYVFLASDESRLVYGEVIGATGGGRFTPA